MLSVVICFYNQSLELATAIQGWKNQTNKNFELVIVRDGGNEDPRDVVAGLEFVKVVDLPGGDDTFKLAAARNLGIKTATTDYIVFTDSDCVPSEDMVELHITHRSPKTILTGFRCYCQREFDYNKIKSTQYMQDTRLNRPELDGPINEHYIYGCNFSLDKTGIVEINGFDEEYHFWGAEERDLVYRLKHLGYGWKVLKESLVYHIDHPSRNSTHGDSLYREKLKDFTVIRNQGRNIFQ